ncbi:hypothetical protein JCM33374_g2266 [Metschnikowia sp. JCM 33374]|nr:hypothetical protein JCM33374_g2266 [Metschnikowia sp. JCM 33374]
MDSIVLCLYVIHCPFASGRQHTVNYYDTPPPIHFSLEANKFLSLPQPPTHSFKGSDNTHIYVPGVSHSYIWELVGYYWAATTGDHVFSIGKTDMAILSVGVSNSTSTDFDEIITEKYHVFTNAMMAYTLDQGMYYPVRVTYVAGIDYVPVPGSTSMFSWPRWIPPEHALADLADLSLIHEGYVGHNLSDVKPITDTIPYITEVTGHFQTDQNGIHGLFLPSGTRATIQIGEASSAKKATYFIDNKWTVIDSRSDEFGLLTLTKHKYYPFRVVFLGNDTSSCLEVHQYGPLGAEIDLFHLANIPPRPDTDGGPPESTPAVSVPKSDSNSADDWATSNDWVMVDDSG